MLDIDIDSSTKLHSVKNSYAKVFASLVHEYNDDQTQDTCFGRPSNINTEEEFVSFIASCKKNQFHGKGITFAIFHENKLIGSIEYSNINTESESVEIKGWVIPPLQGKGVLTKCCNKLIGYAFNELNLKKIEIQVAKNNQLCRAMCENLNMEINGIKVNVQVLEGNKTDIVVYCLQSKDTSLEA